MSGQSYKMVVTPLKRAVMIILIVLQYVFFLGFIIKTVHYVGYPIPFLFSSPTLLSQIPAEYTHFIWNSSLYLLFFLQHYLMATVWFKKMMASIYREYPFYQRYIYNICSGILYMNILDHVMPTYELVFQGYLYLQLSVIVIAVFMQIQSNRKLGSVIMFPIHRKKVLNDRQLEMEGYSQKKQLNLITSGAYGWCRHPMQTSVILLFLFASPYFTKQRLIFIAVHIPAIIIGVIFEENRSMSKFLNYQKYKNEVPYMFIKGLI